MALEVEAFVVGGGPAGLAAATELARAGVEVILADEQRQLGGRLALLGSTTVFDGEHTLSAESLRRRLQDEATVAGAILLPQTLVWGLFGGLVAGAVTPGESLGVHARALILAPGSVDRPLPSPGWTLPAVLTPQEVLRLIWFEDAPPGQRYVVAGAGGSGVPVALVLKQAGFAVRLLVETETLTADERTALNASSIPSVEHARIAAAEGQDYLKHVRVEAAKAEQSVEADVLVLATGRTALAELCWIAGCTMTWEPSRGGYVPARLVHLESSVPGLYVAGSGGGVCGFPTTLVEGHLAGAAAAVALGKGDPGRVESLAARRKTIRAQEETAISREMTAQERLEADTVTRVLNQPDLLLCRCERVPIQKVRDVVAAGARTPGEVKRVTRVGMGECQGRTCRPLLSRALAQLLDVKLQDLNPISYRPPVRPIPIESFLRSKG